MVVIVSLVFFYFGKLFFFQVSPLEDFVRGPQKRQITVSELL